MIAFKAVFALRTIRSQMPDMLDAVGSWKTYLHPRCSSSRSIFWPFHFSMLLLNSRSGPTKFDPLSHRSSKTSPRRFMNLRRYIIKSSVLISAPTLSRSPAMFNVQRTEQVHTCVREWRFVGHHSTSWQGSHLLVRRFYR